MPSFSALIHAGENAQSLARALETLRPADEVVVVHHADQKDIRKVVDQYGARPVAAVPGVAEGAYAVNCQNDWILCLRPTETLSEALEAALFEWKRGEHEPSDTFSMAVRVHGTSETLEPETRLVNRSSINWAGELPPSLPGSQPLSGHLLRFHHDE